MENSPIIYSSRPLYQDSFLPMIPPYQQFFICRFNQPQIKLLLYSQVFFIYLQQMDSCSSSHVQGSTELPLGFFSVYKVWHFFPSSFYKVNCIWVSDRAWFISQRPILVVMGSQWGPVIYNMVKTVCMHYDKCIGIQSQWLAALLAWHLFICLLLWAFCLF